MPDARPIPLLRAGEEELATRSRQRVDKTLGFGTGKSPELERA